MQRRTLLKHIALLGAGAIISFKKPVALPAAYSPAITRPFHRFRLGQLTLTVITDGHISLAPVQPNFPNGTETEEKALLRSQFRSTEAVDLGMNILLIEIEQEKILIDTGTGGSFGADSGWLLSSLADAGVATESITGIVISHAHPDHIGGLLTKEDQPVFPNAQLHIAQTEYDFWMAPTQDFSRSKFQNKQLLSVFTKSTQHILQTLQSRLHLFENKAVLFNCLRMELAPGHTPGHALTYVFSGTESIVHMADLIHSDVLLFPHPEWGFNGDTDIEQATATRRRVLASLAEAKTMAFGYHLPWPGIGHIKIQGSGFEWIAETYAFPIG